MLEPDRLMAMVRRLRAAPLLPEGEGAPVAFGQPELCRLLPHRPPMLLVDAIDAIDIDQQRARGSRLLRRSDLGFAGHFEGHPVYPGVLTVETMGQVALTLLSFVGARTVELPPGTTTPAVRITHIHHATFLAPLHPGDRVVLHAQVIDAGLTMVAAGQAYKGETLAAYAVSEVYIDE